MSGQDPYQNDETNQNPDNQPTGPVPDPMATPADGPAAAGPAQEPTPEGATEQVTREIPPAEASPGWQGGYEQYQQAGYQDPTYAQGGAAGTGYAATGYAGTGYSAPGYGYAPPAPRTDDKAIWALVSSIAGFFLCPVVLHVVGWVLANQSLRTIRESRGTLGGDGVARAARVLGIVGVVLYGVLTLLAILFFALLIPLGIFAASTSTDGLDIGSDRVVPTAVSQIDGKAFTHDVGDVAYDLTAVDFSGQDVDMGVEVGAGTLLVEVPEDVTVTVDAQVGAGELDLFGQRTDGINVNRDGTFEGSSDGGTLDLDLNVGLGELEVSRG